jgi:hypothetical protein
MLLAALGTAAGAAMAGCTAPTSSPWGGGAEAPITVSVHQSRSNVAARQLSIAVTNDGELPIEITAAQFVSDQFVSAALWPKDSTTIRPGVTADLPVSLPDANCSATDPSPVVELTYRPVADRDGSGEGSGEAAEGGEEPLRVALEPDDPLGQLEPLFITDCLQDSAAQIATITATTAPRISDGGGRLVAELDLTVTPAGGRGSLTVRAAHGTTLFSEPDPTTNAPVDRRVVDVAVAGDAPQSILTLSLVPSRCDPHAVAEDKLGTVFPLEVSVAGDSDPARTGVLTVPASDDVRASLYEFVDRSCGR